MWSREKETRLERAREAVADLEIERKETVSALEAILRSTGIGWVPPAGAAPSFLSPPGVTYSQDVYTRAAQTLIANADALCDLLACFDSGERAGRADEKALGDMTGEWWHPAAPMPHGYYRDSAGHLQRLVPGVAP